MAQLSSGNCSDLAFCSHLMISGICRLFSCASTFTSIIGNNTWIEEIKRLSCVDVKECCLGSVQNNVSQNMKLFLILSLHSVWECTQSFIYLAETQKFVASKKVVNCELMGQWGCYKFSVVAKNGTKQKARRGPGWGRTLVVHAIMM